MYTANWRTNNCGAIRRSREGEVSATKDEIADGWLACLGKCPASLGYAGRMISRYSVQLAGRGMPLRMVVDKCAERSRGLRGNWQS
jgi:hypothetical protein